MLFFSGWGILIPVIGALGLGVTFELAQMTGRNLSRAETGADFLIGGVVAAVLCWWLGSRTRASFMFIPAKAYAVLFLVIFGFVAAQGLHP